jgi:Ca2+:H+ antiporter
MLYSDAWFGDLHLAVKSTALFPWLVTVIMWCAFGVVEQAEHLVELLGEPLGTLILMLSIVVIEAR